MVQRFYLRNLLNSSGTRSNESRITKEPFPKYSMIQADKTDTVEPFPLKKLLVGRLKTDKAPDPDKITKTLLSLKK